LLYGKTYQIGEYFGIIPRQINGYKYKDSDGSFKPFPMGQGQVLTLAGRIL